MRNARAAAVVSDVRKICAGGVSVCRLWCVDVYIPMSAIAEDTPAAVRGHETHALIAREEQKYTS